MRLFLTAWLVACSTLRLSAATPTPVVREARPNFVFIYADDWGWGDLSCHGHPFLKTPNLDRLAAEGTDFQQFNVLSPICSPSRVAALTGRYPARYHINDVFSGEGDTEPAARDMPDWLDPKAPTTARLLHESGYHTAHFGKWHLCADVPDVPPMSAYGFDESAVYHGPGPKVPLHEIGDYAARFIEANRIHPFYVDVWLHESHLAHDPTPASMERWKGLDEQKQVYAAVITDGDNAVGKVLDALDRAGVAQNTVVIFSSDNGPESTGGPDKKGKGNNKFGSYYSIGSTGGMRGAKRSLFEGGVRLPFLVRWPGHTPAGVKNDTTACSAVDLLPTFCAAAGVKPPADQLGDGESLLAAFNGQPQTRTRPLFWLYLGKKAEPDWWPRLAVRDGPWKLVLTEEAKRVELHDVLHDRTEAKDEAAEHPEVVARLTQLALQWRETLPTRPNPECLSKAMPAAEAKSGPKPQKRVKKPATEAANPHAAKPGPDRSKAFERWDKNQDGILSFEEYQTGLEGKPNLETRYKNFDKDKDGHVTREEYLGADEK